MLDLFQLCCVVSIDDITVWVTIKRYCAQSIIVGTKEDGDLSDSL